ncbi:unnamed protein product [Ectocarpus fasciculatus]
MSFQQSRHGSDEDDESENEESTSAVESVEGSVEESSSSSESDTDGDQDTENCEDIEVDDRKGADVLLNIHDQLDLEKLQQMKRFFIADDDTSGAYAELDMKQFSDALRSVLPDIEDLTDEDLGLLFMKIDANGSGDVDWDEFTGFLLQLDEGNRNMAAAAHMVDLKPLPRNQRAGADEHAGQHRDMIEKVINVERPGISAYLTCGRDGAIKFWNKGTFAHYRTIRHLDTMKAAYEIIITGGKGREVDGNGRRVCSAEVNRAVKSMKSAWIYDIQQMPLSNRIAAACFDRTVSFYDVLTGEFVCRIGGLRSSPTCVDCVETGANEQQVLFGDLDGVLHVWSLGKHFYIPGLQDTREATDLHGNYSLPLHCGAISCVGYVADLNATVTCGMDGKVHFFDLTKRRITRTFRGHVDRPVFAFAYSKRHRFVISAGMGRAVVFWNSYTMHVLARRDGHAANVRHCLVDDRSDRVITISADKAVRCWDSATFRCIQSFKDHRMHRPDDTITAALWDHSRSSLVVAGSRLSVWKNKGAIQSSKHSHEAPVTAALYNWHFHQIVSGDAMGNVHVWLVETGLLAFRFGKAHGTSKISCMAFDASERRLLTGANDGTVKLWNFNNGKELRLLLPGGNGSGGKAGKKNEEGNERNEVSGVVYCRDDGKGSDNEVLDYVATCSWDKQVRVFAMESSQQDRRNLAALQQQQQQQNRHRPLDGGETANVTVASRVFPGEGPPLHRHQQGGASRRKGGSSVGGSSRSDGEDEGDDNEDTQDRGQGHSADILAIAYCGRQQVATAGFDGRIFIWGTESGKPKFSMKPSDHDVSQLDEVSSIGGLTSVARWMARQRKKGGKVLDTDSVDSGGYLDRMRGILAEDASMCHVSWDGREYFAEERMGGSDDGSGTAQAANHTADPDPEGGSAAAADVDENADTAVAGTTAAGMPVVSGEKAKANSSGSVEAESSAADVGAAGSARKGRGGALCPPDQTSTVEPPRDEGVVATGGDKASLLAAPAPSLGVGSGGKISSSSTTGHGANSSKAASATHSTDGPAPESGSASLWPAGEVQATELPAASEKGSASVQKQSKDGRRRQEEEQQQQQQQQQQQGVRKEGKGGEESGGHGGGGSRSKADESSKAAATAAEKKEDGGVDGLLENAVSHTVDCLIYIRCHNVLCSGTASGELHVWDASTGAFIFGVAARHPNNPGLTAMSTNEGPVEGGGGLNADTSEGPSGRGGGDSGGDGFGVGATRASPAAVRSTTPVAGSRSNLMLFTACEEGFVKTWRLGE